jgi:hypothetical protein
LNSDEELTDYYMARQAFFAACALPSKQQRKFEDFRLAGKKQSKMDPLAHAAACERLTKNGTD